MDLEKHELKGWVENSLSVGTSLEELLHRISKLDVQDTGLQETQFIYQMAMINPLAAFLYWQKNFQGSLRSFLKSWAPERSFEEVSIATSALFPVVTASDKILFLSEGEAKEISVHAMEVKRKVRPLAFNELDWFETSMASNSRCDFEFSKKQLHPQLILQLPLIAAMVAGIKKSLFEKALKYSQSRIQGGRPIVQWSEVQRLLNTLWMIQLRDEVLIQELNVATALIVLEDADRFASMAMQVFGGAGYIEDFKVESGFRECVFLKNYLMPFKEAQMSVFASIVPFDFDSQVTC
jgi:hypothetical protein